MNNTQALTRKIQLKELEILKAFQILCSRHKLRYFAIGGTCIGAVRHKGFIPWDDDIDVAMPYEDYVKFLELAKKELPKRYAVLDHTHCRPYIPSYYCKMHDTDTALVESFSTISPERYSGIYIDIFPVHGAPESGFKKNLLLVTALVLQRINVVRRLTYAELMNLGSMLSNNLKLSWFIFYPLKLVRPFYYFSRKIERMMSNYPFGSTKDIIFPWRGLRVSSTAQGIYSNFFFTEDFMSTIDVPFEDTTIQIPVGYDRYLKMDFGDYMKLPPEDLRISTHSDGAIIDLEKSYRDYISPKEA